MQVSFVGQADRLAIAETDAMNRLLEVMLVFGSVFAAMLPGCSAKPDSQQPQTVGETERPKPSAGKEPAKTVAEGKNGDDEETVEEEPFDDRIRIPVSARMTNADLADLDAKREELDLRSAHQV